MQFMYSLGNANTLVSVVGKSVFDSNWKKSLPFTISSMHLFCDCSDEDQNMQSSKKWLCSEVYKCKIEIEACV